MRLALSVIALGLLVSCAPPAGEPAAPKPLQAHDTAQGAAVSITDLGGTWRLEELPSGTSVPDEFEVTLTFDGNRASGKSGCNSYQGEIDEKESGTLAPGLMAGTQMFCEGPVMGLESAYLKALGSAGTYRLEEDRLSIDYRDGEDIATMVFVRSE